MISPDGDTRRERHRLTTVEIEGLFVSGLVIGLVVGASIMLFV